LCYKENGLSWIPESYYFLLFIIFEVHT
jgi:hypothetical protein